MRTDYVEKKDMELALRLLTPANALAVETALRTGLRIGDVLAIKSEQLSKNMAVFEHKTHKTKRVRLSESLYRRLQDSAGEHFVFESPRDHEKPRTRQAVWYDVKRAAKALRLPGNVAPHSARKTFAVNYYRKHGLKATQKALNHSDVSTTLIYLLSELI